MHINFTFSWQTRHKKQQSLVTIKRNICYLYFAIRVYGVWVSILCNWTDSSKSVLSSCHLKTIISYFFFTIWKIQVLKNFGKNFLISPQKFQCWFFMVWKLTSLMKHFMWKIGWILIFKWINSWIEFNDLQIWQSFEKQNNSCINSWLWEILIYSYLLFEGVLCTWLWIKAKWKSCRTIVLFSGKLFETWTKSWEILSKIIKIFL